jgi:acyl-CoA synthetase (AMP-forming)/AMP-acid ligase II
MLITSVVRAVCTKSLRPRTSFPPTTSLCLQSYRMASTLPNLPIFQAITKHDPASTAIIHSDSSQSFSYGSLLRDVVAARTQISQNAGNSPLHGERIAFLAENSYDYVGTLHAGDARIIVTFDLVTFLAILAHEAIALPLSYSFPASELRYLLENSDSKLLLSTSKLATKAKEILKEGILHKPVLSITGEVERASSANNDSIEVDGTSTGLGGFMLYTSGTTSRPVRSTSSPTQKGL